MRQKTNRQGIWNSPGKKSGSKLWKLCNKGKGFHTGSSVLAVCLAMILASAYVCPALAVEGEENSIENPIENSIEAPIEDSTKDSIKDSIEGREVSIEGEKASEEKAAGSGQQETISIHTEEDLRTLAKNCALDTWSKDKTITLEQDIVLGEADFLPIPSFSGTFDGKGHAIGGVNITGNVSLAGLFGILQPGAVVSNLNVSGNISPSESHEAAGGIAGENFGFLKDCSFTGTVSGEQNIGGIAGINQAGGIILNCNAGGVVFGEQMTGGIVGCNLGRIRGCVNQAGINTENKDSALSLEELELDFTLDLNRLASADILNAASDTGGIAGYSSGSLEGCKNYAMIGYQHVGYNVGGIAGRSCGYLYGCENYEAVYGRKDVGGILGQAEPYIEIELTEGTVLQLQNQLSELSSLLNKAANDAEGSVNRVSSQLSSISGHVEDAFSETEKLHDKISSVSGKDIVEALPKLDITPPELQINKRENGANGILPDINTGEDGGQPELPDINIGESGSLPDIDIDGAIDKLPDIDIDSTIGKLPNIGDYDIDFKPADITIENTDTTISDITKISASDINGLNTKVENIGDELEYLNQMVSGDTGVLSDDLQAVNGKFNEISDTLSGVFKRGAGHLISDISNLDIGQAALGTADSCANYGSIYGDINVGGVAGTISVENGVDPEDDFSYDYQDGYYRQYQLRAILYRCIDAGTVSAKRNYAGGICGRMDLGLIERCGGFGSVESENGDYVGGISGLTASLIQHSFAKCSLQGGKFIGGIVGSGIEENVDGSSSMVSDCYSLVEISEYIQNTGAVAGTDKGDFERNYFVSDTLAGLDRVSFAGRAEPISFDELAEVENLPEQMQEFTLEFVADEEVLSTQSFSYGDSFGKDVYPEIPEKEGYYGKWDKDDLSNLHFDTTVTAEYMQLISALVTDDKRESGRSVFYVEGKFSGGDSLSAEPLQEEPNGPGALKDGLGSAVACYFSEAGQGTGSLGRMNKELVEGWHLSVPDDGEDAHIVRYLSLDENPEKLAVYIREGDRWNRAQTGTFGTYLTFALPVSSGDFVVLSTAFVGWVWMLAGLLVLAAFFLLFVRMLKRAKGKRADTVKKNTSQTSKGSEESIKPKKSVKSIESVKSKESEKLRQPEGVGEEKETEKEAENKKSHMGKKRIVLIVVSAVLLLLVGAAIFLLTGKTGAGIDVYQLLEDFSGQPELSMTVGIDSKLGEIAFRTDADVSRMESNDRQITRIENNGFSFYYADDMVILENGKAYKTGGQVSDYTKLLSQAADLYKTADITVQEENGKKGYQITADGENARRLLEILLPSMSGFLPDTDKVEIRLEAEQEKLSRIYLSSSGILSDEDATAYSVSAELTVTDWQAFEIPKDVEQVLSGGTVVVSEKYIGGDFFRLLSAFGEYMGKEQSHARIQLSADLSVLSFDDTLQYDRTMVDGLSVGRIRKNGISLYISDGKAVSSQGKHLSGLEANTATVADKLLELAYQICLNGEFNCMEAAEGEYLYTLSLNEEEMEAAASAIAPEAGELGGLLTYGNVQVTIAEGQMSEVRVDIGGNVSTMLLDAPISLSGAVIFVEADDFTVPGAVLDAFKD